MSTLPRKQSLLSNILKWTTRTALMKIMNVRLHSWSYSERITHLTLGSENMNIDDKSIECFVSSIIIEYVNLRVKNTPVKQNIK